MTPLHVVLFMTTTQVFSCKICEIFKDIYFEEQHLRTVALITNSFQTISLFLCPHKHQKNPEIFSSLQGIKKETNGMKWVNFKFMKRIASQTWF